MEGNSQIVWCIYSKSTVNDLVDKLMQRSTCVRMIHVPGGNVLAWLWTGIVGRDSQRFGRKRSINLRSAEELWLVV